MYEADGRISPGCERGEGTGWVEARGRALAGCTGQAVR